MDDKVAVDGFRQLVWRVKVEILGRSGSLFGWFSCYLFVDFSAWAAGLCSSGSSAVETTSLFRELKSYTNDKEFHDVFIVPLGQKFGFDVERTPA